ncbi:MAG: flagellar hook-associated protein FlgK [Leptospirillum sp.]
MSGILGTLNIGTSGIEANQAGLSTAGNNIANVHTPGYTQEEVVFDQNVPGDGSPGMVGNGVRGESVRRVVNQFLDNQMIRQKTRLGFYEASRISLGEIDSFFANAQSQGLAKHLSSYMSSWETVANHPLDRAARASLISGGKTMATDFHEMAGLYSQSRDRLGQMVQEDVARVNVDLGKIAALNRQIIKAKSGGESPNTLIDQRSVLASKVSKALNAHFFQDRKGAMTLHLGGQISVSDVENGTLSSRIDPVTDSVRILIDPPGHSGSGPIDITDRIKGGTIGGYLNVRDVKIKNLEQHLDVLAHSVINHVNAVHASGYGLSGATGVNFFHPTVTVTQDGQGNGVTVVANAIEPNRADHPLTVSVSAGKVTVTDGRTGAVVATSQIVGGAGTVKVDGYSLRITTSGKAPGGTFHVSGGNDIAGAALGMEVEVKDPADLAAARHPVFQGKNAGDNRNAHDLFGLLSDRVHFAGTDRTATLHDFYSQTVAQVGSWSREARDNYKAQMVIEKGLKNQRMSVSGVSIADESARIIQYEKAYQASASLVQMTNRLLDTLVHLPNQA